MQRNGVTAGQWIAQRNLVIGERVLCQVDGSPVTQFCGWRNANKPDDWSLEWMYPYVKLLAGQKWQSS